MTGYDDCVLRFCDPVTVLAKLSTELDRTFLQGDRTESITLRDLLDLASERTFGFLFVLLALPSALPVPAPGYSVPFGILLFLLAMQLVIGAKQPWLPPAWLDRGIKPETANGIIRKAIPWLQRVEVFSRPRLTALCTSRLGSAAIGLVVALLACSMMIPIPGTNTIPAMGIFLIGFGLLDDDGFISLVGLTVGAIGITLTTLILRFGYEAVSAGIKLGSEFLKNLF